MDRTSCAFSAGFVFSFSNLVKTRGKSQSQSTGRIKLVRLKQGCGIHYFFHILPLLPLCGSIHSQSTPNPLLKSIHSKNRHINNQYLTIIDTTAKHRVRCITWARTISIRFFKNNIKHFPNLYAKTNFFQPDLLSKVIVRHWVCFLRQEKTLNTNLCHGLSRYDPRSILDTFWIIQNHIKYSFTAHQFHVIHFFKALKTIFNGSVNCRFWDLAAMMFNFRSNSSSSLLPLSGTDLASCSTSPEVRSKRQKS